ncbi:MAG: alanine--tRNA ligase [Candidatus Gracilibacteria bacterium]|jgi:alanyl-tRNA synthetase
MLTAAQIRRRYLDFFVHKHGHAEILGASLIPENDPTVLFTTAGMHPLVPYLMGEKHPAGTRLTDVQRCVRTGDIDEVGDPTHLTFFEMLGNWSLGDYFKEGAIKMSFEFLTSPQEEGGLGIDVKNLAVTCFEGDENAPRDEEAAGIWRGLGIPDTRIAFLPKEDNWWGPAGLTGPCGPDTEMFYWTGEGEAPEVYDPKDKKWVEIWNDVFMQYNKNEDGSYTPLEQKNVDTGMGLERTTAILQGKKSPYETELFEAVMQRIRNLSVDDNSPTSERIVADHIRTATFILGDERGVTPSNVDQGYVLRRLIRRAIRHGRKLGIQGEFTTELARLYIGLYGETYKELVKNEKRILESLKKEEEQFQEALNRGEQEIQKDTERVNEALAILAKESKVAWLEMALSALSQTISAGDSLKIMNESLRPVLGKLRAEFKAEAAEKTVDEAVLKPVREKANELIQNSWALRGERAFFYFESYGFPLEMTMEMMQERGVFVDKEGFEKAFKQHQEKSRVGAEQKFAGGLADHSFETTKLHTATHLMLEALRRVLGKTVEQKGSNITQERLRFDFNYPEKLTPEQIAEVERIVNAAIAADHPVHFEEMTVEQARTLNATGVFIDKYEGELEGKVKVYMMGDYSKEICGGPHVEHTGLLAGHFKIVKEESSSSGIRRIKAVLEPKA